MGLYDRWILPRLLDLAMRSRQLDPYRQRAIAAARGRVLEIGAGSGLNFALYGPLVERVCALDPSPQLLRLARTRLKRAGPPLALVRGSAERLPFADASFDTVVTTWTLCSVPDPAQALAETRRVLKSGGCLVFVEHGLAPEPGVARWQRRLTPCWRPLAGGCRLDRRIDELVRAAGFRIGEIATEYAPGPKPWTYFYQGTARR